MKNTKDNRGAFSSMTCVGESLFMLGRTCVKWFSVPKPAACQLVSACNAKEKIVGNASDVSVMLPSMTEVEGALLLLGHAYLKHFNMPTPLACWSASSNEWTAVEFEVYLPLDEKLILCKCRVAVKDGLRHRVDIFWFHERFDEPGVTHETLLVDDLGVTLCKEPAMGERRVRANDLNEAVKEVFSRIA